MLGRGVAPRARVWSGLHAMRANEFGFSGSWAGVGMTWTAPVAYCGDYSCLSGAVGASVNLKDSLASILVLRLSCRLAGL